WKYEPSEIRIKRGEVVRVDFSATDNGLGAGHGFAIDGLDRNVFINGAMVGAPLSVVFKVDNPGRYNFYCSTQCSTTDLHPHMHGVLIVESEQRDETPSSRHRRPHRGRDAGRGPDLRLR